MPLTSAEDQHHLTVAEGYTELGMYLDANAELEEITGEERHHPVVLAVRVIVYEGLEWGELMQTVAGRLAALDPKATQWAVVLAYATRRAQSVEDAKRILLAAVERDPGHALLHYNLACYECQLGELEVAKARLAHSFRLDEKLRLIALNDNDLKPIWDSLAD